MSSVKDKKNGAGSIVGPCSPEHNRYSQIWHCLAALTFIFLMPGLALAQSPQVSIELNKIETNGNNCRAYLVVNNTTQTEFQAFKLDLVLFQPDGVIGRRFALDLAPLRPEKKTVKLFNLDGVNCDNVGSFLINDIMECSKKEGAVPDCYANVGTSSLTKVQLTK